jgi:hypothetical protein
MPDTLVSALLSADVSAIILVAFGLSGTARYNLHTTLFAAEDVHGVQRTSIKVRHHPLVVYSRGCVCYLNDMIY